MKSGLNVSSKINKVHLRMFNSRLEFQPHATTRKIAPRKRIRPSISRAPPTSNDLYKRISKKNI